MPARIFLRASCIHGLILLFVTIPGEKSGLGSVNDFINVESRKDATRGVTGLSPENVRIIQLQNIRHVTVDFDLTRHESHLRVHTSVEHTHPHF